MERIKDFENYLIDEYGNVFSLKTNKYIKQFIGDKKHRADYLRVELYENNKRYFFSTHRLVALTYIPNPDNLPQVNHKDGNKLNNHISNLEWCTHQYNVQHSYDNGLKFGKYGSENPNSKLTEKDVKEIRRKYIPRIYTHKKLALEYGVTKITILRILNNQLWNNHKPSQT